MAQIYQPQSKTQDVPIVKRGHQWGSKIGGALGAVAGGVVGGFAGGPAGAMGGASAGMGLGSALGSFGDKAPRQTVQNVNIPQAMPLPQQGNGAISRRLASLESGPETLQQLSLAENSLKELGPDAQAAFGPQLREARLRAQQRYGGMA